jgi:hypothetical protein
LTFPICVELDINGTWVDVSERARHVPPTIHRGRPDETSTVAPTSMPVVFDNTDGFLTPSNPESPWYPHIRRGLPCRICVEAGDPYLLLSGAAGGRAQTPDNAALDITSDLFMAVELAAPVHIPTEIRHELFGKWTTAGDQRSYYLNIDTLGRPVLYWSTAGTLASVPAPAISTYLLPMRTAGPISFAVYFDPNFGGANHVAFFYGMHGTLTDLLAALNDDETAVQLGDVYVGSGTTSIFSGTAPLQIGDIATSDAAYVGGVRRAQVRSGDWTGTIVANPDFTTQTIGATSFTDSATRVWSIQGDASITNRQLRLYGRVSAVELDWPKATTRTGSDDGVATATVTVAGDLRRMQQGDKPIHSSLYRLISSQPNAANIIGYWPLEDGPESSRFAAHKGTPMKILSGIDPGADSSLAASEALPTVQSGTLARYSTEVPVGSSTSWVVDQVVRIPTLDAAETRLLQINTQGTVARWQVLINDTNVRVVASDSDESVLENQSNAHGGGWFDHWFLLRFEATQSGGSIDWSWDIVPLPETGFAPSGVGASGTLVGTMGRVKSLGNRVTGPSDGVSFGHIVLSNGGHALGWLAGADTAWAGETAAHRVWRLCREESIPIAVIGDNTTVANVRGDTTLSEPMGAQRPLALIDLLQECAEVDRGILYEQRGTEGLAFRTHQSLHNQASVMTFDTNQWELTPPFGPVLDDQRIRNDITVKRTNGSSGRQYDQDSIDSEGLYDVEIDVNVTFDEQTNNQASWRLHLGTWPELQIPTINTSLLTAGNPLLSDWLDVDLGDRFTATNLMRQYNSETTLLLEGYDEILSLFNWEAAIIGSPAGPWEIGVRGDDERGKRDTPGSTLANNEDTTDVNFALNENFGAQWTTAAGDYPIDLNIGGEQVTATAAINVFGLHVFTVIRSINGVVKGHAAGTSVSLWRPTVRAL